MNNTFYYTKHIVAFIVVIAAIVLLLSSCYRQGYGCHGNSRIITRVK